MAYSCDAYTIDKRDKNTNLQKHKPMKTQTEQTQTYENTKLRKPKATKNKPRHL